VRRAQPYRFFAGEELVLGVAGRAGGGRERVQDPVHVEQEQGEAGGHGRLIVPSLGRGQEPAGAGFAGPDESITGHLTWPYGAAAPIEIHDQPARPQPLLARC
jgi:hypothetical protein